MELSVRVSKPLANFRLEAELEISGEARWLALFGPSGAGKTMLLRSLAGLERPESGWVRFAGETWFDSRAKKDLRPQARRVGFLFQEGALFPHLSVNENLRYGGGDDVRAPVALLGLEPLLDRMPRRLSAGERQRVALARVLAPRPRLLLLDEPFSALDQPTRERLRVDLRRALDELGIPAILVTHDRAEAQALADHLALISDGVIRQTGSVADVFARPRDLAVARAVGFETIVPAESAGGAPGRLACVRGEDLVIARDSSGVDARDSSGVDARDFSGVDARDSSGVDARAPSWRGRVTWILREDANVRVGIDAGPGIALVAILSKREFEALALREGEPAIARAAAMHFV